MTDEHAGRERGMRTVLARGVTLAAALSLLAGTIVVPPEAGVAAPPGRGDPGDPVCEGVLPARSPAQGFISNIGQAVYANPDMTGDGRYVGYDARAPFARSGAYGYPDGSTRHVWVHDRDLYETDRVDNAASPGAEPDANSWAPALSDGAATVVFASEATNLVVGDTNGAADVFAFDRQGRTTTLVSRAAGGGLTEAESGHPAISGDGNVIAFWSLATNIVPPGPNGEPGDTNNKADVFVHNRATATTTRVSEAAGVQADADSFGPAVSRDGHLVAFESSSRALLPAAFAADGAGGDAVQVFVKDLGTGAIEVVSLDPSGALGDGDSAEASLSADGRYVAFTSRAGNLVAGDTNGAADVFVRDRDTGETTLVSVKPGGGVGEGESWAPDISGGGRFVTFTSRAPGLDADARDFNRGADVFVRDTATAVTSVATLGRAGDPFPGDNYDGAISDDGLWLVHRSGPPYNAAGDPVASEMALQSMETPPDPEFVFVGGQVDTSFGLGLDDSAQVSTDTNAAVTVFQSAKEQLLDPEDGSQEPDTNHHTDIFAFERATNRMTRVSVATGGAQADNASLNPSVSADGDTVVFLSSATNLASGVTGTNAYVRRRAAATTTALRPVIDGEERALWIPPRDALTDGGATVIGWANDVAGISAMYRVGVSSGSASRIGPDGAYPLAISGDGTGVAYLLAGDLYVISGGGAPTKVRDNWSTQGDPPGAGTVSFSADGSKLAYHRSVSTKDQVVVFDVGAGTESVASVTSVTGVPGNDHSRNPSLNDDGRYVVFQSRAGDLLVPGGAPSGAWATYSRDLVTGATTMMDDWANTLRPFVSGNGDAVAFLRDNSSDDVVLYTGETCSPQAVIRYTVDADNPQILHLDAGLSRDPDGGPLGYRWLVAGDLAGTDPQVDYTLPPEERSVVVELTVTDDTGVEAVAFAEISSDYHTPFVGLHVPDGSAAGEPEGAPVLIYTDDRFEFSVEVRDPLTGAPIPGAFVGVEVVPRNAAKVSTLNLMGSGEPEEWANWALDFGVYGEPHDRDPAAPDTGGLELTCEGDPAGAPDCITDADGTVRVGYSAPYRVDDAGTGIGSDDEVRVEVTGTHWADGSMRRSLHVRWLPRPCDGEECPTTCPLEAPRAVVAWREGGIPS